MTELLDFLRARLDEDERVAREAESTGWHTREPDAFGCRVVSISYAVGQVTASILSGNAQHIARHDPARILAEVEAKRRRIEHYLQVCQYADPAKHPTQEYVLAKGAIERSLMFDALPYSDHADYREEWRP